MPFTEVFVVFGQKKEQYARLLHTQNISRQWNFAVNMMRLRSEGFYNRQKCTDNNFSLSSNYTSKSQRYSFLVNGIVSAVKTDENGGLKFDTLFENNLSANKKLLAVNLLNARTRRGNREFTVAQFLNFGKRDSVRGDTTGKYILRPKSSLSYSFHLKENWFVYDDKDPGAGFYESIFYDSTATYDSTSISTMENIISFSRKNKFLKGFSASDIRKRKSDVLAIGHEISRLKMIGVDTTLSSSYALVRLDKLLLGFRFYFSGKYYFNGYSNEDYRFSAKFKKLLSRNYTLSLHGEISETSPAFIFTEYSSNHFWWKNSLEKIGQRNTELKVYGYKRDMLSFNLRFSQLFNHTYFDTSFFPRQFGKAINIYSATVQKTFSLKKFKFYNKITYQDVSHGSIIHLPQFISNHSLYLQDKWFKKAVDVQLGFDVTFFSAFFADAYMPALGSYYLQYEKKIGSYPFVDFFFSMKVKHARIFFKTEHINSGFSGAYYLAPNYPAPDRSIKVGINWIFFD